MQKLSSNSQLWTVLKIGLALALTGFVLSRTSISDVVALRDRFSAPWLLIGLLAFWANIWLYARRYWLLLRGKATFRQILSLVVLQNVLGNLVATSAGAVSYLGVLRRKHDVQLSEGISSLLLTRFGDMLAMMLTLAVSSAIVWQQVSVLHIVLVLVASAVISVILVFVLVLIFRQRIVDLLESLTTLLRLNHISFFDRVLKGLRGLAEQDPGSAKQLLWPLLVYTALSQISSLVLAYATLRLFAVPLGFWQVVFSISLIQFMSLVPIQVFGGLGISDVTSLYLYGLFGIGQALIAPAIIGPRVAFYLMNIALFLYFPIESRLTSVSERISLAALDGQARSGE